VPKRRDPSTNKAPADVIDEQLGDKAQELSSIIDAATACTDANTKCGAKISNITEIATDYAKTIEEASENTRKKMEDAIKAAKASATKEQLTKLEQQIIEMKKQMDLLIEKKATAKKAMKAAEEDLNNCTDGKDGVDCTVKNKVFQVRKNLYESFDDSTKRLEKAYKSAQSSSANLATPQITTKDDKDQNNEDAANKDKEAEKDDNTLIIVVVVVVIVVVLLLIVVIVFLMRKRDTPAKALTHTNPAYEAGRPEFLVGSTAGDHPLARQGSMC